MKQEEANLEFQKAKEEERKTRIERSKSKNTIIETMPIETAESEKRRGSSVNSGESGDSVFDELLSVDSFAAESDYNEGELERLVKMQYVNQGTGWDELSFDQKMKLFNKWSIAIVIGDLFTIFGAIFYLNQKYFQGKLIEGFIGFGCFFTWVSVIRYLENTAQFTIITRTFSTAIPKVARLQFGILPLYVGYILMGRALFWQD